MSAEEPDKTTLHHEEDKKESAHDREIPEVGTLERDQPKEAATKSDETLGELGPDIQ